MFSIWKSQPKPRVLVSLPGDLIDSFVRDFTMNNAFPFDAQDTIQAIEKELILPGDTLNLSWNIPLERRESAKSWVLLMSLRGYSVKWQGID